MQQPPFYAVIKLKLLQETIILMLPLSVGLVTLTELHQCLKWRPLLFALFKPNRTQFDANAPYILPASKSPTRARDVLCIAPISRSGFSQESPNEFFFRGREPKEMEIELGTWGIFFFSPHPKPDANPLCPLRSSRKHERT